MTALFQRLHDAVRPHANAALGMVEALDLPGMDIRMGVGAARQSSLFFGVPESKLRQLVAAMEPRRVKTGETIVVEGERAREFAIVMQGRAVVERHVNGEVRAIGDISRPTLVGEESLVGERGFHAGVRMTTDGVVFRMSRTGFGEFAAERLVSGLRAPEATARLRGGAVLVEIASSGDAGRDAEEATPAATHATTLRGLRRRLSTHTRDALHICCSVRAYKSALAAFLLTQWGYDAVYLKSGVLTAAHHMRGFRRAGPNGS